MPPIFDLGLADVCFSFPGHQTHCLIPHLADTCHMRDKAPYICNNVYVTHMPLVWPGK